MGPTFYWCVLSALSVPDGTLGEMFKGAVGAISLFFVLLFNKIFDTAQYPEAWRVAIFIPLHKSGDCDNPDNYRGIPLLSILGKVFSHILNKRLTNWVEDNKTIVEERSGFRPGRSSIDNIVVLY